MLSQNSWHGLRLANLWQMITREVLALAVALRLQLPCRGASSCAGARSPDCGRLLADESFASKVARDHHGWTTKKPPVLSASLERDGALFLMFV